MALNLEINRLRSFHRWTLPVTGATVLQRGLAKDGFYAMDEAPAVKCYFCDVEIRDCNEMIPNITESHRQRSPNCEFLLRPESTNNLPLYSPNELKDERNRMCTFADWPVTFISPAALAKAGFFYTHVADEVQCAWCIGIIGSWETGDDPFTEHRKFFPTCVKVREIARSMSSTDALDGVQQVELPLHPQYASLDARFRSFQNWNLSHVQQPKLLSKAGFYYQGVEDEVRCFHCDGGLRHWLLNDDPWFEHARCFPNCNFVQLVMGQTYVTNVLRGVSSTTSTVNNLPPTLQRPPMTLDEALNTKLAQLGSQLGLNEGEILQITTHQVMELITGQSCSTTIESPQSMQSNNTSNQPTPGQETGSDETRESKPVVYSDSIDDVTLELREENTRLREARECKICLTEEVGVVFCPCGHLVSCVQCAPAIYNCPVCRALITGRVRTFLS